MKRLFFPGFVLMMGPALLAFAACDPDLSVTSVPGEGGTEAGPVDAAAPPSSTADTGAPSEAGPPSEGGTEAGVVEHQIDGTNDFTAGEKFTTSSGSPEYDGFVSYDAKKIYFGMSGPDVGAGQSTRWVLVYVDGVPGNSGTSNGIAYDCSGSCAAQQASLPFAAGYHYRWKADGSYSDLQKWNGTAWVEGGSIASVAQKGTFMEVSLTRALLGSPTKLKVHMTMLIEQTGAEWTYAGVPSTSFTDGKAPATFTKYFEFDLSNLSKAPNTYATSP